jgi:hypothetical protein
MQRNRAVLKRLVAVVGVAVPLAVVSAPKPASAVVHEIYAAWCAGKGEITPPGLADDTKKSFAKPVLAGGVVALTPYLDGVLIDFDFDKAQAKIVPLPGNPIIPIGEGLYLEGFMIDPEFPAFLNCPRLEALAG